MATKKEKYPNCPAKFVPGKKIPLVPQSVIIEGVTPEIDSGRWAVKREIGDTVTVEADIYKEGHEPFEAYLLWRLRGAKQWHRVPMEHIDNDRHRAEFTVAEVGFYEYTVAGWPVKTPQVVTQYDRILSVKVDRVRARCAAWYEMWPRSQGTDPHASATFDDMIARLPEIQHLGFDVIYLTPIHPIGQTNRKGKNNALQAEPGDPGCPYAVGNRFDGGGHDAIEPGLGTLKDFDRFVAECHKHGMEVALDIAHTCSPDHPYVPKHPEWYYREADGTIKFAENPPKRYEDIYPFNFYSVHWESLWLELKRIFAFWISHGVKIFRVDNPHTKPVVFWQWVIAEIHREHPDVIFLAEAFTKPKMMKMLAKAGYTQSYTYFTWRNHKQEFIEYLTELTQTEMAEYYRGNFFANTPDILPVHLQEGGRPAFIMRLVLAATLSSVYGIYNGFELCENTPKVPGKEEYLDSEKYQFKVWDWDRPGNIKDIVAKVNAIRRANAALQEYDNLRFVPNENGQVLTYYKMTPDRSNIILVAVNLDWHSAQTTTMHLPLDAWGIEGWETYRAEELLAGTVQQWKGGRVWGITLAPQTNIAAIWRISKQ